MKKFLLWLLAIALWSQPVLAGAAAADGEGNTIANKLTAVERVAYGETQTGSLIDRVHRLEQDFAAGRPNESVIARVDNLYDLMYGNVLEPSLISQMNAIEWSINREISTDSLVNRIAAMETVMDGKASEGSYRQRISQLSAYAFGSNVVPLTQVKVPANTLIRIASATPINAKQLRVGDVIEYRAAEDVIEGGHLLIAKGSPGQGKVTKVSQAKNFGRDAQVQIDFDTMRAIDGSDIPTLLGEESKKQMESMAMAAGASAAGLLILGPVGAIGGVFVKGRNVNLPAGTEFYIQVREETSLYGLEINN